MRARRLWNFCGYPVFHRKMLDNCQPPTIASNAPLTPLSNALPRPKGNIEIGERPLFSAALRSIHRDILG